MQGFLLRERNNNENKTIFIVNCLVISNATNHT